MVQSIVKIGSAGETVKYLQQSLVSEMNAGAAYETMILQCITNTLGIYYGVKKVYLTVEGKPYSSGHIEMKKGVPFIVDLKDAVELK